MFNGSIVNFFSLLVKKTGRKLAKLFMIDYAITADPFSWTRFICAVAVFQIPFFVASHIIFLSNYQYSIPFFAFIPLEKACFPSRISVTVSAISRSSRGAFLPVSTMQSFLGLFFIRLIVSSTFKSP